MAEGVEEEVKEQWLKVWSLRGSASSRSRSLSDWKTLLTGHLLRLREE